MALAEPSLRRKDAELELVGGKGQLVGPAEHGLEVARVRGDGPPDFVERYADVLAEPQRHKTVEDECWPGTGRGAEVQELGAERRTEAGQAGRTVVA